MSTQFQFPFEDKIYILSYTEETSWRERFDNDPGSWIPSYEERTTGHKSTKEVAILKSLQEIESLRPIMDKWCEAVKQDGAPKSGDELFKTSYKRRAWFSWVEKKITNVDTYRNALETKLAKGLDL